MQVSNHSINDILFFYTQELKSCKKKKKKLMRHHQTALLDIAYTYSLEDIWDSRLGNSLLLRQVTTSFWRKFKISFKVGKPSHFLLLAVIPSLNNLLCPWPCLTISVRTLIVNTENFCGAAPSKNVNSIWSDGRKSRNQRIQEAWALGKPNTSILLLLLNTIGGLKRTKPIFGSNPQINMRTRGNPKSIGNGSLQHSGSFIKKALKGGLDFYNTNLGRNLGDGMIVHFWYENWTGCGPLRQLICGSLTLLKENLLVKEVFGPFRSRSLDPISFLILTAICNTIKGIPR